MAKKGFTLAETIVAISIIVIISISAFSVCAFLDAKAKKVEVNHFFVNQMNSVFTCFNDAIESNQFNYELFVDNLEFNYNASLDVFANEIVTENNTDIEIAFNNNFELDKNGVKVVKINIKNENNNTILEIASYSNQKEICKIEPFIVRGVA